MMKRPLAHRRALRVGVAAPVIWGMGACLTVAAPAAACTIQHHDLHVELRPQDHEIVARDTIQLAGCLDAALALGLAEGAGRVVRVRLNPALVVENIERATGDSPFGHADWRLVDDARTDGRAPSDTPRPRTMAIQLPPSSADGVTQVRVSYRGRVRDAPTAVPGLRFVRPDRTTGYVGDEGVYLTSDTFWYPDIPESFATFHVVVTAPAGWRTVTHGRETSFMRDGAVTRSVWDVRARTPALTLAANRFVKHASTWHGVEVAAYLLPENAALSTLYTDAAIRYVDWYADLLGPYPFPKFAVVENFFSGGIGLPSFTLLGGAVIKRGYTHPYALGHEIVHSWLGNAVHNHVETGNWVEGLTTYLANYYYDEQVEGDDAALAHRRHMIMDYNAHVSPDDDYPVAAFRHKDTRVDHAIGYQKTAMIFHRLRRRLGDRVFFRAVRDLVAEYTGRYADWPHLRRVFEAAAGRDLSWFFHQWVDRSGAPRLHVADARVERDHRAGFWVHLRVTQSDPPYRLRLPVLMRTAAGRMVRARADVRGREQRLAFWIADTPVSLRLDAEYQLFRRVPRRAMPPMLNGWVTAPHRAVVMSSAMSDAERRAYTPARDRIRSHPGDTTWPDAQTASVGARSVLAMGTPDDNPWIARILRWCGPRVTLRERTLIIDGVVYAGERMAALVNCAHPLHPEHVGAVFFGFSPDAVRGLARLLFFYGWDSYGVFDDGRIVARGMFDPPTDDLTVTLSLD